ncbi:isocitrate lyase/PEP mutase family protein [Mycolicibacterium sp. XJ870]
MLAQQVLQERATALLAMHQPGNPVVLPTVWDAWSAKLAVEVGFAALTVGSHPVADSIGKADGEVMSFEDLLTRVRQITAAVEVPVSVDIESGYGEQPARLIEGLLDAGAVGFNLEDTVHKDGGRLRTSAEHAALVGELRAASDAAGVHVVINARTDLFLRNDGDDADRVDRAIARLSEAAAAGADSLFPAGLRDPEGLGRFTSAVPLPVSVTVPPDTADRAELAALGVGRITFGPFLQWSLGARGTEILARWI